MALLDDMLAGNAPNAGRFCAACYHPMAPDRAVCPHCGLAISARAPVEAVPMAILYAHRLRRGREGLVVRTVAWTGLLVGIIAALMPFLFGDVTTWTIVAFFGLMAFFYLLSANLANSVGDAVGYRWGLATFRKRWDRFVAQRDAEATSDPA
jgi:hypothetical protein